MDQITAFWIFMIVAGIGLLYAGFSFISWFEDNYINPVDDKDE